MFLYISKQCFMKIEFQNSIRRLSFLYRRPDIKTVRINPCDPLILKSETYPEPWKTSEMELFAKIVNCFQPLTISVKSSISNVWQGSEYTSEIRLKSFLFFCYFVFLLSHFDCTHPSGMLNERNILFCKFYLYANPTELNKSFRVALRYIHMLFLSIKILIPCDCWNDHYVFFLILSSLIQFCLNPLNASVPVI